MLAYSKRFFVTGKYDMTLLHENTFIVGNFVIEMNCENVNHTFELGLSLRERQALKLFAQGYCAQDAAIEMGISKNTVDTFRRRIFEKLGVNTTAEAITIATAWWANADMRVNEFARAA